MAIVGAATDELRQLSGRLRSSGEALAQIRSQLDAALRAVRWDGVDSARFRQEWESRHAPTLSQTSLTLSKLAQTLTVQAREQDEVSRADGAGATPRAGIPSTRSADPADIALDLLSRFPDLYAGSDALKQLLEIAGLLRADDWQKFRFLDLPGPWGAIGLGIETANFVEAIRTNDPGRAIVAGIGVVGAFLPPPVGLGVTALTGLVEVAIPYSNEKQDALLDWQAQRMFGAGTDDLTPDQSSRLGERYEGPLGVANMLSDQMDKTADDIGITDASRAFGRWIRGE